MRKVNPPHPPCGLGRCVAPWPLRPQRPRLSGCPAARGCLCSEAPSAWRGSGCVFWGGGVGGTGALKSTERLPCSPLRQHNPGTLRGITVMFPPGHRLGSDPGVFGGGGSGEMEGGGVEPSRPNTEGPRAPRPVFAVNGARLPFRGAGAADTLAGVYVGSPHCPTGGGILMGDFAQPGR